MVSRIKISFKRFKNHFMESLLTLDMMWLCSEEKKSPSAMEETQVLEVFFQGFIPGDLNTNSVI